MALNFPTPATLGDIYIADNGVTYTYDGVKWVGSSGSNYGDADVAILLSQGQIIDMVLGNALIFSDQTTQTTAYQGPANQTDFATSTDISTAINNLINSAPGTLDTLGEIAANLATSGNSIGSIINSITSTNSNVSSLQSNVGAYQIYANANLGTATTNINNINANVGAYQTWANAQISQLSIAASIPATSVTYTATSQTWTVPTANVNSTLNTVTLMSHNLSNGDAVIYYANGGSPIAPLTNGTTYYIRVYDSNNVYLYDTAAHAIATPSTTGLKDLGATGTNAQYFTTAGTGIATNLTFNGTTNRVFIVNTATSGNIVANITANLSNGQAQEYKFVIPGGATNYSFIANTVNSTPVTGITTTITSGATNVIDILLVRLSNTYTIYVD